MPSYFAHNLQSTKICFNYTILLFSLPICLSVKHNKELSPDAEKITEKRPELGYKNCFTVTDDKV